VDNNFIVDQKPEPPEPPEPLVWTTEDEMEFIKCMFRNKNICGLEGYARVLPYRLFWGEGMYVDWDLVRMRLDSYINSLKGDGL
jgi:hypothetical protein